METVLNASVVDQVKAEFGFTVDKFPMFGPERMKSPCYGLFRSDNGKFVGSCNNTKSKDYVPHQTDDVIALVEASSTLFEGDVDVRCHFNDGHYVSVQPPADKRLSVFGTKDNVFPRIIINAGYNGTSFKASMGYYRDLCQNLSIMRMVKGTTVSIRHMSNLRSEMNELIDTFGVLGESWEGLAERIQALEATKVNLASVLDSIYGEIPTEPGRGRTTHDNRNKAIITRIFKEQFKANRHTDDPQHVTAWEAFNGVQGFSQWTRFPNAQMTDFQRAIKGFSDKHVQKAEKLLLDLVA
jgi:hypothetical protein